MYILFKEEMITNNISGILFSKMSIYSAKHNATSLPF